MEVDDADRAEWWKWMMQAEQSGGSGRCRQSRVVEVDDADRAEWWKWMMQTEQSGGSG